MKLDVFYAFFMHIVYAKLSQVSAGDNEMKLICNMSLSGFELPTQGSVGHHAASGLLRQLVDFTSKSVGRYHIS